MARSRPRRRTTEPQPYLTAESQRALINRLARIEGHVRSVATMVEDREWADEILLQVTAIKGGLNRFAASLVENELQACLACADDRRELEERVERLTRILATILKQT